MEGLEWLARFTPAVRKLAKKMNPNHVDELFDVAIDKCQMIYECWDPDRGTLYTCMMRHLKWKFHVWNCQHNRRWNKQVMLQSDTATYEESPLMRLVAEDEVYYILERLSDEDRQLLSLRYVDGMSVEEVGDLLGVHKSHAARACRLALNRARDVCRGLEDHRAQRAKSRAHASSVTDSGAASGP